MIKQIERERQDCTHLLRKMKNSRKMMFYQEEIAENLENQVFLVLKAIKVLWMEERNRELNHFVNLKLKFLQKI